MGRRSITAVIFDLDGTLIRSSIDFVKMKNMIIAHFRSLEVDSEDFSSSTPTFEIVQKGIELLRKKLPEERVSKVRRHIEQIMTDVEMEQVDSVSVIPGVSETVKLLKEKGIKIGILTRSCREYALRSLEATGLSKLVDSVAARDDIDRPKPNPDQVIMLTQKLNAKLEETLMVGDHPIDALCARNSNVRFIGVLTGSSNADAFRKIGCDVIGNVNDLPKLLIRDS